MTTDMGVQVLSTMSGEISHFQACVLSGYLTLCDPMDCSTPGSSVHTILQARILEQVSISFSRGSSNPGIKLASPALQADSLPSDLAKPLHFSLSA